MHPSIQRLTAIKKSIKRSLSFLFASKKRVEKTVRRVKKAIRHITQKKK